MNKFPSSDKWRASLGFKALVIQTTCVAYITSLDTGVTHAVALDELGERDKDPADVIANRVASDVMTDIIIEGLLEDADQWDGPEDVCPFCGI
jgi:hypothetical protein